jgi:hypothetical protein
LLCLQLFEDIDVRRLDPDLDLSPGCCSGCTAQIAVIPGVIDAFAASCAQFRSEPVHLSSVGRAFFVFRNVVGAVSR